MLNVLDPQVEVGSTLLRQRQERKAYLLWQGKLLSAAYEAGQLQEMLKKLKAEQHKQGQNRRYSRTPPARSGVLF